MTKEGNRFEIRKEDPASILLEQEGPNHSIFRRVFDALRMNPEKAMRAGLMLLSFSLSTEIALGQSDNLIQSKKTTTQERASPKEQDEKELQEAYFNDQLKPSSEVPRLSKESIQSIETFLAESNTYLEFKVLGRGMDRSQGFLLDAKKMPVLKGRALLADGRVTIRTSRLTNPSLEKPKIDESGKTINGFPMVEQKKDRYGNMITISRSEDIDHSKYRDKSSEEIRNTPSTWVIKEDILIEPRSPFLEPGVKGPIRIDFEVPFEDHAPIEGFLYLKGESPLFVLEGYPVYGTVRTDLEDPEVAFRPKLLRAIEGFQAIDQLFGGRQYIKGLDLSLTAPDDYSDLKQNAFVMDSDPWIGGFTDDMLNHNSLDPRLTAFHEGSHGVDLQIGVSSDAEFVLLFKSLSPDFFKNIDEKAFLKDSGMIIGGHSAENELELFATLMNSLNHPQWNKKATEMNQEFIFEYRRALQTVLTVLSRCGKGVLPEESTIFPLLKERIGFLGGLINP